jgi:hypothetical protein
MKKNPVKIPLIHVERPLNPDKVFVHLQAASNHVRHPFGIIIFMRTALFPNLQHTKNLLKTGTYGTSD